MCWCVRTQVYVYKEEGLHHVYMYSSISVHAESMHVRVSVCAHALVHMCNWVGFGMLMYGVRYMNDM